MLAFHVSVLQTRYEASTSISHPVIDVNILMPCNILIFPYPQVSNDQPYESKAEVEGGSSIFETKD
jgi:hypothetical protein